jgi:hypothetical protein
MAFSLHFSPDIESIGDARLNSVFSPIIGCCHSPSMLFIQLGNIPSGNHRPAVKMPQWQDEHFDASEIRGSATTYHRERQEITAANSDHKLRERVNSTNNGI